MGFKAKAIVKCPIVRVLNKYHSNTKQNEQDTASQRRENSAEHGRAARRQRRPKRSRAEQGKAAQGRAEKANQRGAWRSKAEQREQSRTEQGRARQSKA